MEMKITDPNQLHIKITLEYHNPEEIGWGLIKWYLNEPSMVSVYIESDRCASCNDIVNIFEMDDKGYIKYYDDEGQVHEGHKSDIYSMKIFAFEEQEKVKNESFFDWLDDGY
jgi:hypothetical protein